ncbi:NAD(P)H-binding protein, partial [Desulfobacter postgatei]
MNNVKPILVTGATGYVSGRLIPLLLADGYKVKAMGRSIPKMKDRPWGQDQNVELVKGDIQDVESLKNAAKGCGTV